MIKKFFNSFGHAVRGLKFIFTREHNFRIQLICAVMAAIIGLWLRITVFEWSCLGSAIVLVLLMEMINTAFEKLLDLLKPRLDQQVGLAKDIMAGAVLVSSAIALIVGFLIFIPAFIELIKKS